MTNPLNIALQFVRFVNDHNIQGLTTLITDDHTFIDSLGAEIHGRAAMRNAWIGYFVMIPDYTIVVQETFVEGQLIVILGRAHGTYAVDGTLVKENHWELPLALRAVVRDGKLAEWRVYADNEPVRAIMKKYPQDQ